MKYLARVPWYAWLGLAFGAYSIWQASQTKKVTVTVGVPTFTGKDTLAGLSGMGLDAASAASSGNFHLLEYQ